MNNGCVCCSGVLPSPCMIVCMCHKQDIDLNERALCSCSSNLMLLLAPLFCPAVRGDLIRILNKLAKRRNKFDHVLIETTGGQHALAYLTHVRPHRSQQPVCRQGRGCSWRQTAAVLHTACTTLPCLVKCECCCQAWLG